MMEAVLGTTDPIVVTAQSMASDDARDVIQSNIDYVNMLFSEQLNESEISHDAFVSYYVDYYLAQINNGGFAQFVANTGWNAAIVNLVREGLQSMAAPGHAALFEQGAAGVAALGDRLDAFLASEFFGKNAERDQLNAVSDGFYALEKKESLEQRNAAWIRARPDLVVVDEAEIPALIAQRAAGITDRDERMAAALEAQPEYMKLIRRLCDHAGHTLDYVTAGDPAHQYQGAAVLAWHFITDQGHHFMVEADGKAMMFAGNTEKKLAELVIQG